MDSLDGGKHENNKKGKYILKVLYSLGPSSPPLPPSHSYYVIINLFLKKISLPGLQYITLQ